MTRNTSKGGERVSPVVEPILPGFADAMLKNARLGAPLQKKELVVPAVTLVEKRVDPKEAEERERRRNNPRNIKRAEELKITIDQFLHIYDLGEKTDHIIYMLEHGVSYEEALKDAETIVLLDNK